MHRTSRTARCPAKTIRRREPDVPFTPAQKLRLMAAYAPVLYLHRDERFVPISPTAYLERAALWDDLAPGSHLRESWGHPTEGGGGLGPPPAFPRAPLLRPGQLTVTPAAAGGDVHFLGEPTAAHFRSRNRMPNARCSWITAAGGRRENRPTLPMTLATCGRPRRTAWLSLTDWRSRGDSGGLKIPPSPSRPRSPCWSRSGGDYRPTFTTGKAWRSQPVRWTPI